LILPQSFCAQYGCAIVGTLVNIGLHKITLEDFSAIIESKNRDGFSVPAHGLYLTKIEYDYL
jgi:tRNA pseudouridine38-40 synthase